MKERFKTLSLFSFMYVCVYVYNDNHWHILIENVSLSFLSFYTFKLSHSPTIFVHYPICRRYFNDAHLSIGSISSAHIKNIQAQSRSLACALAVPWPQFQKSQIIFRKAIPDGCQEMKVSE